MRPPHIVATLLVLATMVAGGALECSTRAQVRAQRGEALYGRMCAVCHGASGEGYKADNAPAIGHPDFLASVSDDFLRTTITEGRGATTMSAWGAERGGPLQPDQVDAIISFLRSWEVMPRAQLDDRPLSGDATRGAGIFDRECTRCHGTRGRGGPNVNIGHPELLQNAGNGLLRYAIHHGRVGTAMPAFADKLGDQGIDDVIAALRSWRYNDIPRLRPPPARAPPLPLGPVPLNPKGPEPSGFRRSPLTTSAEIIKAQLDRGARMALLDARAPSDYTRQHIAGAVSVPFYDPDPYVPLLPKNAWLVCYCSCPHAESGQLAAKLMAKGFTKVTVLDEGLGYWNRHGYPTSTGTDP